MFLPLYILVAVVNIVAKNNNYYIKTPTNPDFDVRVRRETLDGDKSIDLNGVIEGESGKEGILLKELFKIYTEDDENLKNLKVKEGNSVKIDDSNVSGEVTELKGKEKVIKDIASVIDDLKVLLSKYNDNYKNNINANARVRREVESSKNIEGDVNSDIAELERNAKLWKETAIRDIENLWNNISSEFDRLGKLMSQYQVIEVNNSKNIGTKVKREIGSVKINTNDDKINDKIVNSNNAKVLEEIASLVDEVKKQITEYNDYIGKNPNVVKRVRSGVYWAKIKDNDSAEVTGPKDENAKGLEEIVTILIEIQGLISDNKNGINDKLSKPDSRVKRETNPFKLPPTGFVDMALGNLFGYNEINIGDEVTKMENHDKEPKYISSIVKKGIKTTPKIEDVGELFPRETHIRKILSKENPVREISPQEIEVKDFLPKKNEVVPWPAKLVQTSSNETVEKERIVKDYVLKEKKAKNIPKQDKKAEEIVTKDVKENLILLNEDEGKFEGSKISKENDIATPGDLTQIFDIKRKKDEGNGNQIINFKDEQKDIVNLKIDDDIQTLKILKAFDDIDDLLEVHALENSVEEEKIMDEKGVVQRHTKSVQVHQLIVDYTNSHELKDAEKPKVVRTKDDHLEENRLKQVSRKDGIVEKPKRITLMKILIGPTVLNESRVKREASPENSISKFFSNIYTKVYDMTHSKKDKDVDNNLLLSDGTYNSYDSPYQPNNIKNNQNSGYNQFQNNHIIDNSLTHSDYTYNNNYDSNKPIYNSATNTNQYGYGYNTPGYTSGLTHSAYMYNSNNGYEKPFDRAPANSNMYGNVYNAPTNSLTHSNYFYNNNYGDKPIDKLPINSNMYGSSYNAPTNGININIPAYNYNYANGNNYKQSTHNGSTYTPNGYPYNPSAYNISYNNPINGNNLNNTPPDYKYNYRSGYAYNTTTNNGYGYNSTQDYGYGYNTTMANELNNNGNSTEATIVPGCIFCSNFGCQKNYRWMGVACVPIKG